LIYLIFGPDTYRSKKRLSEFCQKHSTDQGWEKINGAKISWSELQRILITPGFFEQKKLIEIDNLFLSGKPEVYQKVLKNLKNLSAETILIFYESAELPKSIQNRLPAQTKIEQFLPLTGPSLYNWIRKEISSEGGRIEPAAVQRLVLFCGSDLWRVKNEIDKLVCFRAGRLISVANVELLVISPVSTTIFNLIDAIGEKKLSLGLQQLKKLLDQGENELYIFSMIIYQFRNLIQIKELIDQRLSLIQIQKKTGIHPYVIRKTLNQARNFSLPDLRRIYHRLLEAETSLKTGRNEPEVVLDLLVLGLAS